MNGHQSTFDSIPERLTPSQILAAVGGQNCEAPGLVFNKTSQAGQGAVMPWHCPAMTAPLPSRIERMSSHAVFISHRNRLVNCAIECRARANRSYGERRRAWLRRASAYDAAIYFLPRKYGL